MNKNRVGNVHEFLEREKSKRGCRICGRTDHLYFKQGDNWNYKSRIQNIIHSYTETSEAVRILDKIDVVCRKCVPVRQYKSNNDSYNIRRLNIRKWFKQEKEKRVCEICGRTATECPEAFSFHHVENNKTKDVSIMAHNGSSKKTILKEIEKCIFVCECCHRKIHFDENNKKKVYKNPRRRWFENIKMNTGCFDCGIHVHFSAIDFHHLDNKKDYISNMVSSMKSETEIIKELEKCVPLCAVCHKKRHSS